MNNLIKPTKAIVTTSLKLSEPDQVKIKKKIKNLFPKSGQVSFVVDKNVISGLRVQVGDRLYDNTVAANVLTARMSKSQE